MIRPLMFLALLSIAGLLSCDARKPPLPADPDCQEVLTGSGPAGTTPLKVEKVVDGLEVPWGLAFLPGGDLLVTERPGRVRLVRHGALVAAPVATLAVGGSAEAGLLGIAAHPDFAANRFFYLYLTAEQSGQLSNRVERWKLSPDGLSAAKDRVILQGIPSAQYHDGGRLRFGPDGMLYVGTGDSRNPPLAQDVDSLAGKLLRLTPEGAIPADNPFPGKAAFVLGVRNTQGFDWLDAHNLVLTDHGPSGELGRTGHDEVNLTSAGANLGWPKIYSCETQPGLVTPLLTWKQAVPPGGAALYKGDAIPGWKGSLVIGTLGSKHLHRVVFDADHKKVARHEVYLEGDPPAGFGRLREVVIGPDQQLYVTTSNCDGRGKCPENKDAVLRIVAGP